MRNKPEKKCTVAKGKTGKKERIYHYSLYKPPNKQQNNHGSWFKKKADMHIYIYIIYIIIIQLQKSQKIIDVHPFHPSGAFDQHWSFPSLVMSRGQQRQLLKALPTSASGRIFIIFKGDVSKPNKHSSKKPGFVNCSPFLQISVKSVNHPFQKFNEAEDPGTI